MSAAHFNLPLNLPHAATIAHRILYHVRNGKGSADALARVGELIELLEPWRDQEENGANDEAERVRQTAAMLGRLIVEEVEGSSCRSDRLGQAVRNLFECLGLGAEGAEISLRAGENPNSTLRP